MSVGTVHMVYFPASSPSEIFPKNDRELGWVAGNFMQVSMGLRGGRREARSEINEGLLE